MNKNELMSAVGTKLGVSKRSAEPYVNAVFDVITEALAGGEDVKINKFGVFSTAERNGRIGRNPQTGEAIEIPAKLIPRMKFSKGLKDFISNI